MDEALLHRLANICKDYYVLRSIDDLFIYAGAKSDWLIKQPPGKYSSQRVEQFYGWIEGINTKAADRRTTILIKVMKAIVENSDIPPDERAPIDEEIKKIETKTQPDKGIELEPLLSTLARSLASDGLAREVAILTSAEARLEWIDHDNWGDVHIFNLILSIPYKLYDQIKIERELTEEKILGHIRPLLVAIESESISKVTIACKLLKDDNWREKALAWLTGQNVNNQGRVRSDNVAPRTVDGLQFRSEAEINLYRALKPLGVSFAPLAVFVRGGREYRRIEPDFVVIKEGVVLVVEVDGDTFHRETPAEAYNRTMMLENEGARIIHVQAKECETPEKAALFANKILKTIAQLKEARR